MFVVMVAKLQSIWDGHLSCINAAKHRIKLLDDRTKTVHFEDLSSKPKVEGTQESENRQNSDTAGN